MGSLCKLVPQFHSCQTGMHQRTSPLPANLLVLVLHLALLVGLVGSFQARLMEVSRLGPLLQGLLQRVIKLVW